MGHWFIKQIVIGMLSSKMSDISESAPLQNRNGLRCSAHRLVNPVDAASLRAVRDVENEFFLSL